MNELVLSQKQSLFSKHKPKKYYKLYKSHKHTSTYNTLKKIKLALDLTKEVKNL